jgi:hypothetical protein
MAMSCGQGSVVGWHAAGASERCSVGGWFCGSAGASPSQGVGTLEIPVCGAGIGDMQRLGGRGAITLVECCGGESRAWDKRVRIEVMTSPSR